jgi:hypothetical protein
MGPGFHAVLFLASFCASANDLGYVDRYLDKKNVILLVASQYDAAIVTLISCDFFLTLGQMPSDNQTFWRTTTWSTYAFPATAWCVGHCGSEISNSLLSLGSNGFSPEVFRTSLCKNGCLAFRSPVSEGLRLKLKSSVLTPSLQGWPVYL